MRFNKIPCIFGMMNDPFLTQHIRDVPDFPQPGIIFKDIAPLLASAKARQQMLTALIEPFKDSSVDVVVGIESRGFLFGMLIAEALNAEFVMLRKPNKLPGAIFAQDYGLEYGTDRIEIQQGVIAPHQRVLIHDDVLASGGTAGAAIQLVEKLGGKVVGCNFMIEIDFLKGRDQLKVEHCHAVLHY